jgi:hypothetical protein
VVTSRLRILTACAAMGVPVIFVWPDDFQPDEQAFLRVKDYLGLCSMTVRPCDQPVISPDLAASLFPPSRNWKVLGMTLDR